ALDMTIGTAVLGGQALGVLNQLVGVVAEQLDEVDPSDAEAFIHEVIQVLLAAEGQITLENDSIEAAINGYNSRGELGEKTRSEFHGVPPHGAISVLDHDYRGTPFLLDLQPTSLVVAERPR
ncbi:MAG: hypothetical protein GXP27_21510, partial [Planctomycetes bacterium]|nr:hypothetical protein [Planctomycetota bacterium]